MMKLLQDFVWMSQDQESKKQGYHRCYWLIHCFSMYGLYKQSTRFNRIGYKLFFIISLLFVFFFFFTIMLFNTASAPVNRLVFTNEMLEVWKDEISGHHSTYSKVRFRPGDIICEFGASAILQSPSYLTVQIGINEHICLQPSCLQYINHSCSPNMFFDTTAYKTICLQPIEPGDEFCYFYPATEWDMDRPFECVCGSANCLGYIGGASYLSKETLPNYRFTDFIYQQLKNKYSE